MIPLSEIRRAAGILQGKIIRTPLVYSPTFSKLCGSQVYLKLENLQETGSFKLRGATFKIQSSLGRLGPAGVVAASAGNHAQGVALAAGRAGIEATIVMPEWASITKQEATRGYGGKVIVYGKSLEESLTRAKELAAEGRTFIHPFDDPLIVAGQGTIGLEIFEDLPRTDVIVASIGGGGLISGIACAAGALCPAARIIGVQTALCPSAHLSVREGKRIRVDAGRSIADGISVKQLGELNFPIIRESVHRVVLVDEEDISMAMVMLLERKKLLAEGAGAAPVAALLRGALPLPSGSVVVLVISGGNVDSPLVDRIIRRELVRNGRIMRFTVHLEDDPGCLARLLSLVSQRRANVLQIVHDRSGRDLPIYLSRVELELETRGPDHAADIALALKNAGYELLDRSSVPYRIS
ncbi:MAG: threonine ammonia-lyase [Deltaproteobacteria bacterium]|nr:threonine ammonia-lyase [Deltaproteobacteria bacterium]